jgi:hypothetical protein
VAGEFEIEEFENSELPAGHQASARGFNPGSARFSYAYRFALLILGLGLLAGSCGAAAARPVLLALPGAWLIGGLAGSMFPMADHYSR